MTSSPATTARAATVSLNQIKHQSRKDVVGYSARVIEIIYEIEGLIQAAYPDRILALAGFHTLAAAVGVGLL